MSQNTGRQPEIRITDLPHLCSVGPRPQVMTAILRQWMISHFKALSNIEHTSLEGYIWRPDIKTSGILITTSTLFDPEQANRRPAIVIKRNSWKNLRQGIDNRMMGTVSADGHDYYANYWQGSHTLFCLSDTGAAADILAAEVFRELNQFAGKVRPRLGGVMRMEVVECGEAYLLEESTENFAVPITMGYAWEEAWVVETKDTSPLAELDLTIFHP